MRVPLASTGLRPQDIAAAVEVMNSGNLTMGARVKEFESKIADYLRVQNFVMMNSGSSANLAIIEALMRPSLGQPRLKVGDGVLVPAIAWPTTIWPLIQLGLEPIFVDINEKTLALDFEKAREACKKFSNVKAIFPIHVLGLGIPGQELESFSREHNLVLINDVCESLGSWDSNSHSGTRGLAASFSFYFSHHITTMEGGGVATDDDAFADDLRSIRSHGWSRDRKDVAEWKREVSSNDARFLFISTGYNIRPMEIQAAIGISQIQDIDSFIDKRRSNARKVHEQASSGGLHLIGSESFSSELDLKRHSWMMLPIRISGDFAEEKKAKLVHKLNESGIETRPVLTGNFVAQPAMQRIIGHKVSSEDFPNANLISNTSFLIGNHHDFSDSQVDYIIEQINTSYQE